LYAWDLISTPWARERCSLAGGGLLFGYGLMLNLAPLEFGRVFGLYIATRFVMWQVILLPFGHCSTFPILVGGAFIVAGGMIVSFWNP
jgi:hypothetical protein